MRVLLLNPEFPPIGGGGANACYHILRHMEGQPNVQVTVVTSSETERFYRQKVAENVEVHRLPLRKESLHYWKQSEVLVWIWRAWRYSLTLSREQPFDLCHAFFGFPSGAISYVMRRRLPYIVSLRGSDVPGFNERFRGQYIPLLYLFRRIWRKAEAVVANSEGLRDLALRTDASREIGVIPNGIDTREFRPHAGADADEGAGEHEPETFTIMSVCRFVGRKGIPYLLRAMPEIVAAVPHARLRIVGEGERREEWEGIVRELGMESCVEFPGHVPHDRLAEVLNSADVFVLPSLYEGMSNTLLEAIACGLPVVVTDTGGTRELVSGNGIVVPQRNPGAIAEAVRRIATDAGLRAEMGRRSRAIAEEYSWERVAEQYLDLYRQVVERSAGK